MTFLVHVLVGAVGGAITAALLRSRPARDRGAPLAIFLAVAAGIYVGYGLQDGRPSHAVLQTLGALPFIAVAARWPQAVGLLGIAWLAHGVWDGVHEFGVVGTRVPSWYPAACLGLDAVLGVAALRWGHALHDRGAEPSRVRGDVEQADAADERRSERMDAARR